MESKIPFHDLTRRQLFRQEGIDYINAVANAGRKFESMEQAIVRALLLVNDGAFGGLNIAIGKITAVPQGSPLPTYDAESVWGPDLKVQGKTPVSRLLNDSQLNPAQVDDPCFLFKRQDQTEVHLVVWTETAKFGDCGSASPPPGVVQHSTQAQTAQFALPDMWDFIVSRIINSVGTTVGTATDYTAKVSDEYIGVSAVPATITLPPVADVPDGKRLVIKDESGGAGASNITIDGNASENIDGATTSVISTNYGSRSLRKRGSAWFIE